MSYKGGTYGEEVLCSSPTGSLIEISTDNIHQKDEGKNEDEQDQLLSNSPREESDINVYSFNPLATQDLIFESSKAQSNSNKTNSNVISLSSDVRQISQDNEDDIADQDSGLLEISQKDYLNSQKLKLETLESDNIVSEILTETGGYKNAEASSSQVYYDLKSAQTPQSSPRRTFGGHIQSSSPILTQQETQLTSSQHHPTKQTHDQFTNMAPSAQLTSFRMLSPKKVISEKTTPIKSKKNLLVTQESFNIPNLISPSKSSPLKTQITEAESQSIYCTARQSGVNSPEKMDTTTTTTTIKYKGHVTTKSSSPWTNYEARVIPSKRSNEEIEVPGSSDDENDISLIEITKTIKKSRKSILQVPSSPGVLSSASPSKELNAESSQALDLQLEETSTEELKRKIIQYGLKPAKSRIKMIQSIKEIDAFLKEDSILKLSQSQNITDSQNIVKSDVFQVLNDVFLENPKIMEKIYTFEPIETKELNRILEERGIIINYDMLKEWCDRNSICLIEEQVEKKK